MEHAIFKTPIGTVKVTDILFYYDGIRIFIGNNNEYKFLGFLVDEDENNNEDIYLFVPVSEDRISEIKNGNISIKSAIQNAENGWVYEVHLSWKDEKRHTYKELKTIEISKDYLPSEYSVLNFHSQK
jgi:hypothetical protein